MTYRQVIREIALENHGVVTTTASKAANVPAVELRKLASRGALENKGYGVYRLVEAPHAELDQFAEMVFRVGDGAYLMGETVLAIHNLALVNPRKIQIACPRRVRAKLPKFVEVTMKQVTPEEITTIDGIPATTVERALQDCRDQIMPARFRVAVSDARKQGLITQREADRLLRNRRKKTLVK
jgi:predicted transcriptional regulator of viral defense system